MNPKKDDYMRGYHDGFKEGAAIISKAFICPKCGTHDKPSVASGVGLRATCKCGHVGGLNEFTA